MELQLCLDVVEATLSVVDAAGEGQVEQWALVWVDDVEGLLADVEGLLADVEGLVAADVVVACDVWKLLDELSISILG